ncbi:hypothetical protein [Micromonospora sp. KC207]|uniref:hypothetical protein n=1 Tax=Micromonospora sp. KC207 TaxID=2530377 RepID=UPI00140540DA
MIKECPGSVVPAGGPDARPHPAARHTRHQRVLAATQAAAQRERRDQVRAAEDERDQAAVRPGRRSPAAEAALAAIRARASGHLRRAALLDAPPAAGDGECEWPDVAQPGGGLPSAASAPDPDRPARVRPAGLARQGSGAFHPADLVDDLPVIPPPATSYGLCRQQRCQHSPLVVREIISRHTRLDERDS